MKNVLITLVLLVVIHDDCFTQKALKEILNTSNNFEKIIGEAEAYFEEKHPGIPLKNLSQGENRDGEYVKFMRWKRFWGYSLKPDGNLGDPSRYWLSEKVKRLRLKDDANPYENVTWTNISHENYITSQVGMGRTTSMAFHPTDPNIFYVGAAIGGIWKTTDGGQSYTPLGDELPFMAVSCIVVDQSSPNTIYIAISDHVWYGPQGIGIYKSTDGGVTWNSTALSFDFSQNIRIYRMTASPNDPDKMFVATSSGLYRTNDGFLTVTEVSNIGSYDVKIHPDDPNIVYQGCTGGEFYRSLDGGNSFSLVTDFGSHFVYLITTPLNGNKVYARHGKKLFKSLDSGASFPESSPLAENNGGVFVFSPADQNTIIGGYIGVTNNTVRSDDDGSSFYITSDWLGRDGLPLIHADQRNIFVNPIENDYVYFCNDGGVYRYVVSSNSFENLSDGLEITQYYDIAVSQTDQNIIGGGSQDNGNLFRNSAGVWDDYAPTGDGMNQEIDPTNAKIRYWPIKMEQCIGGRMGRIMVYLLPGKEAKVLGKHPIALIPAIQADL